MQSFCKQHSLCVCSSAPPVLMLPLLLTERRFIQQSGSVNLDLHHCSGSGACIPCKTALIVKLNFWPAVQLRATGVGSPVQECFRGCSADPGSSPGVGSWAQVMENTTLCFKYIKQEANFTVRLHFVNDDWKWQQQHACLDAIEIADAWFVVFLESWKIFAVHPVSGRLSSVLWNILLQRFENDKVPCCAAAAVQIKMHCNFSVCLVFFIFENDKIIVSEEGKQMSQLAYLENTAISLRHDLYPGHLIFLATQLDHYNGHQLDILLKWIEMPKPFCG